MPADLIQQALEAVAAGLGAPLWNVKAFFAILLVSVICGLVSPQVVGGRMAFFSDALAHTALAGIAIGVLALIVATNPPPGTALDESSYFWAVPLIMMLFGGIVGLAIAYFREVTGLSADSIIGVFFALSTGFGAMLIPALNARSRFDVEGMLFGSPYFVEPADYFFLLVLLLTTVAFLAWRFNTLVFGGFNPTLATSRGLSVRLTNYLFILLLAMVVNFSFKAVGVLLINALLVVPAAAAANLARNIRQMFWYSLFGSVACGMMGWWISWGFTLPRVLGVENQLRPGGTIVMVVVGWFFLSILIARVLRGRRAVAGAECPC
jgi:zinc transport system permease protein